MAVPGPSGDRMRILLYADTDLNLIDGSSVWTVSVARVLASLPEAELTLLLKRPLERSLVVGDLPALPNVHLVDPWADTTGLIAAPAGKRLAAEDAAAILRVLARQDRFDLALLRGFDVCRYALQQGSVAERVWSYFTGVGDEDADGLRVLYARSDRVLCQTPELQRHLMNTLGVGEEKFLLLPPMIPDLPEEAPPLARQGRRLVYIGKMAPLYHTREMVELLPSLRTRFPDAEFHLAGDKFHNYPPCADFTERMRQLLEQTPGVIWHKALSREDAAKLIADCDLGCSWRHADISDSLEVSTKLLEYAGAGKPAVVNRTPMHEQLLGADYPFYCDSPDEFLAAASRALSDNDAYASAARRLWEVARGFTLSAARDRLAPHVPRPQVSAGASPAVGPASRDKRPMRVAIAGHDLKFIRPLAEALQRTHLFEVRFDEWFNHRDHDEPASRSLLEWADVVVAEWCLGSAVWLSHHLPPGKGLIVRIHRVEFTTDYPDELLPDRVNRIIAIAPQCADIARARLPRLADRVVHIPQPIGCRSFDRRKLVGSDFRLGVCGWVPALKRPDLALDIFGALRQRDRRYQLFLKGRFPTELPWVWHREAERCYYRDLLSRINHSPLRDSVSFDPFGDDINVWLQKIGFVLSTSDVEGCHVSVSEGMASGAVPVIRSWEGAARVYPAEYVVDDVQQAVALIETIRREPGGIGGRAELLKQYACEHFDMDRVAAQWQQVIREVADEASG